MTEQIRIDALMMRGEYQSMIMMVTDLFIGFSFPLLHKFELLFHKFAHKKNAI